MEETRSLEEELQAAKQEIAELTLVVDELNDFIQNSSIPLHSVNGSGIIIWANQAELDLLGYEKDEYVGRHISTFHSSQSTIQDILTRLMNKETLRNYPAQLKCKNGDIRYVLINSNVLWRNDTFVHTRCFTRDITHLKKQEEKKVEAIAILEEKNRELRNEVRFLKQTSGR